MFLLKKKLFIFSLVATFMGFVVILICLFLKFNQVSLVKNQPPISISVHTSSPTPKIQMSAWLPWWNEAKTLSSLEAAKQHLTQISPVWYRLSPKGSVENIPVSNQPQILEIASSSGILVIPSIGNDFDGSRTHLLLANKKLIDSQIQSLIQTAKADNLSGFDVDFEQINPSDKLKFNEFIKTFAHSLHKQKLLLIVTVHALTGAPDDWELAKVHDYQELSQSADLIRIMAYDFHYDKSPPGPVTPISDLKATIEYAIKNIPLNKIVIGVPSYGYDWDSKKGQSFQYDEILTKLNQVSIQPTRDASSSALTANYEDPKTGTHTIWFEDQLSLQTKIKIAAQYGIYQFCLWSLGGEDPKIWPSLSSSQQL